MLFKKSNTATDQLKDLDMPLAHCCIIVLRHYKRSSCSNYTCKLLLLLLLQLRETILLHFHKSNLNCQSPPGRACENKISSCYCFLYPWTCTDLYVFKWMLGPFCINNHNSQNPKKEKKSTLACFRQTTNSQKI